MKDTNVLLMQSLLEDLGSEHFGGCMDFPKEALVVRYHSL